MSRLTERIKMKDGSSRVTFDIEKYDWDFAAAAGDMADKLAHYEDLEEQGRLIIHEQG